MRLKNPTPRPERIAILARALEVIGEIADERWSEGNQGPDSPHAHVREIRRRVEELAKDQLFDCALASKGIAS